MKNLGLILSAFAMTAMAAAFVQLEKYSRDEFYAVADENAGLQHAVLTAGSRLDQDTQTIAALQTRLKLLTNLPEALK